MLVGETSIVEITEQPILPEIVVSKVKADSSGCVLVYVGLIRDFSRGKAVLSVEYRDVGGKAERKLQEIVSEIKQRWQVDNIAIFHRIGKLKVGDVNLVVAVASGHRQEGFAACQYAISRFKQKLPTWKEETYQDGSSLIEEPA